MGKDKLVDVEILNDEDPHLAEMQQKDIEAGIPGLDEGEETVPMEVPQPTKAGLPTLTPAEEASAMVNMQKELADLRSEVKVMKLATKDKAREEAGDSGAGGWPFQYYKNPTMNVVGEKHQQAGWIVIGMGGATPRGQRNIGAISGYVSKGLKPLTDYGVCDTPSALVGKYGKYGILMPFLEAGGATEVPASQVLAYGWHKRPPIPGLLFPQYEEIKGSELEFLCEDCDLQLWFTKDDQDTTRACFFHLRNAHEYSRAEAVLALQAQNLPTLGRFALEAEAAKIKVVDKVKVAAAPLDVV